MAFEGGESEGGHGFGVGFPTFSLLYDMFFVFYARLSNCKDPINFQLSPL
jgi:hypothetical protein